jgi:hypothetical protein
MFEFLAKYIWILGVAFSVWDHYAWSSKEKEVLGRAPELEASYARVMWGHTLFYSLPWFVMGVGIISGGAPDVFAYTRPCSGNLFVATFHLTILLMVLGVGIWIWFLDGAGYLVRYTNGVSPFVLKLQFLGAALFTLALVGVGCFLQPPA